MTIEHIVYFFTGILIGAGLIVVGYSLFTNASKKD